MAYAQRYYDDYNADVVINKLEKYGVTREKSLEKMKQTLLKEKIITFHLK